MKKHRKSSGKRKSQPQAATAPAVPAKMSRRTMLRYLRTGAIAVPVLGVAGYFSVQSVQATICEADLTKIGQGTPSIVQIHDPNCPICTQLQKQARRALGDFEDETHTYLVANIKTLEGSSLAAKYAVPHVTILLFDAKGEMVEVLRGPRTADELRPIFAAHLGVRG